MRRMGEGRGTDGGGAAPPQRRATAVAPHPLAAAVLALLLVATVAAVLLTRSLVGDQEHRLLTERANEVSLVLTTTVNSISGQLGDLAGLAQTDPHAFVADAKVAESSTGSRFPPTYAVLRPTGPGGDVWRVDLAVGSTLRTGQLVTGPAATVMADVGQPSGAAVAGPTLAATPVLGSGSNRSIGFVERASGGAVVYELLFLGPVQAPAGAGRSAFSDLRVVLYATPGPVASQVLVATTTRLPLAGSVRYQALMVGSTRWTVGVSASAPLVGSVAAFAPWAVLIVGLVGSLLVFLLISSALRRRDDALALYRVEHNFAETLQRRLLPTLPSLAGLDIGSRYVAASDNQQVGGDWFDVFELSCGRTAVVIGDVMGHDVEAAAAMAQVRSGLRAYASEGGSPASVLDRLDRLVETFDIAPLVTVLYGIVGAPGPDGGRDFRWSNAGHLPPLVRRPDGAVEELTAGASPLIGVPAAAPRSEAELHLGAGSTLFLYTDGLVESRYESLTDSLADLRRTVSASEAVTADGLCDEVGRAQLAEQRKDDIAMVAVRLLASQVASPAPSV